MKKLIFIGTFMFVSLVSFGQDYISNALLFSRTQPYGSARMLGLGGAHVALGGDYTSNVANPAGLGLYNRNELTITPALNFLSSTSSYYGTSAPKESRSAFSLPGLSLSLNNPSNREKGFLGGTFSLSLTRLNDLHQDFSYEGVNDQNSIVDYFIEDAAQVDPDILIDEYSLTGLAYNNYLIEENYDQNDNVVGYGTVLDFSRVSQKEVSERKGSVSQWSIGYGANFNDRLFVGASVGISSIRYELSQVYTEDQYDYNPDAAQALDQMKVTENFDISGSGVNFSIGAIFRPVDFLQIGASFVTPTYYGLTDKYNARIDSEWNNFEYYEDEFLNTIYQEFPEEQVYEYNITTPLKASAGIAFISKRGFISFNTEYINYSKAKYNSEIAGEFEFENEDISSEYQEVFNHTIGLELRQDIFRFRLGGSYMADPFKNQEGIDRSLKNVSGGVGARFERFFVDLGVIHSWTEGRRIPYFTLVGAADPQASLEFKNTKFSLTFGFTF